MAVRKGDFVEATTVGEKRMLTQGLVTSIYPDGTYLLEMGAILMLCESPKKISERKLSRAQRDWILRRRAALDPVDPIEKHRVERPTPSFVP